jgi:hypothetical protein
MELALISAGNDRGKPTYFGLVDDPSGVSLIELNPEFDKTNSLLVSETSPLLQLVFVTSDGTVVNTEELEKSTDYYIGALDTDNNVVVLHHDEEDDSLMFHENIDVSRVIVIDIPSTRSISTNDTTIGQYIGTRGGKKLVDIVAKNTDTTCDSIFFSPLVTPMSVRLTPQDKLFGHTCERTCSGKKCDETDGCGRLCGCAPGYVCREGECIESVRVSECQDLPCGSLGGFCTGKCPKGMRCKRISDNRFACLKESQSTVGFRAVFIMVLILLIILLYLITKMK